MPILSSMRVIQTCQPLCMGVIQNQAMSHVLPSTKPLDDSRDTLPMGDEYPTVNTNTSTKDDHNICRQLAVILL